MASGSRVGFFFDPSFEIPAYAIGHAPRSAGFGAASTRFIQTFKKRVFQQKFSPKYAYILE